MNQPEIDRALLLVSMTPDGTFLQGVVDALLRAGYCEHTRNGGLRLTRAGESRAGALRRRKSPPVTLRGEQPEPSEPEEDPPTNAAADGEVDEGVEDDEEAVPMTLTQFIRQSHGEGELTDEQLDRAAELWLGYRADV